GGGLHLPPAPLAGESHTRSVRSDLGSAQQSTPLTQDSVGRAARPQTDGSSPPALKPKRPELPHRPRSIPAVGRDRGRHSGVIDPNRHARVVGGFTGSLSESCF